MKLTMVSHLGISKLSLWETMVPPIEEQLASKEGATVVRPPALRRPTFRRDLPAWLSAIRTLRRSEAVFWMQMSSSPEHQLWPLMYVNPLARRSAWVVDSWRPQLRKIGMVAAAQRLSPLFVGMREASDALAREQPNLAVQWLPYAANGSVFRDQGLERDIFAYWMGRRSEALDEAIRAYCAERGLEYRTDRATGDELARLVARARYFVVTPPDVTSVARTGGFSPLALRYFEGLAAGARLLGVLPRSGEYEDLLPLDAVVRVAPDGHDLAAALEQDVDDEAIERAQALVHAHHRWEHRADVIYDVLTREPGADAGPANAEGPPVAGLRGRTG
jgi:hypothetical protein